MSKNYKNYIFKINVFFFFKLEITQVILSINFSSILKNAPYHVNPGDEVAAHTMFQITDKLRAMKNPIKDLM